MACKVYVCQSNDCSEKGSASLLRDIEEMCVGSGIEVVVGSCLNHCGKGPNCEIQFSGKKAGKPKVVEGVRTFKATEQLVKKELGVDVNKLHRHVAELKYEARRDPKHEVRLQKIAGAFKVLGGEDAAARREARLAGDLLAMRAREAVGTDAAAAQKDAELAVATVSDFAGGYTALSLAQEAQHLWELALESAKKAIDIAHGGSDVKQAFQLQKRLEKKIKEIQLQEQKKREDERTAKEAEELKKKQAEEQSSRKDSKDGAKGTPGPAAAKAKARPGTSKSAGAKAKARAQKKAAARSAGAEEAAEALAAREDQAKAEAEAEEKARREEESRKKAEEERIQAEQEAADQEAKMAEAREAEARARQLKEAEETLARERKARERSTEAFRARVKAEQEKRRTSSWFACCAPEHTNKTVVTCSEGHQLKPRVSTAPVHTCAVCDKQMPVNSVVYSCIPCRYNECPDCYLHKLKDDEGADAIQVAMAESAV